MYTAILENESKHERKCFLDISFENKSTLEVVFRGTIQYCVKTFCLKILSPLLPGMPFLLGFIIYGKIQVFQNSSRINLWWEGAEIVFTSQDATIKRKIYTESCGRDTGELCIFF